MNRKKRLKALKDFCKTHWRKWTILVFLAMVAYISLVFYQCIYRPIFQPIEIVPQKLEIKEQVYQEIMDSYFERKTNVENIIKKNYPNPFK